MPASRVMNMECGRHVRITLADGFVAHVHPAEVACRDIRVGDTVAYHPGAFLHAIRVIPERRPPDAAPFSS